MIELGELLTIERAGFVWVEDPGYWSLRDGDVELTLEPQVLNAGAWKLGLYRNRMPLIDGELLVDVKPRPRAADGADVDV